MSLPASDVLANTYRLAGRYGERRNRSIGVLSPSARPRWDKSISSLESPSDNLATFCHNRGLYQEAEPLFRRALSIHEKSLGSDHPEVASTLANLGTLYEVTGQFARAEPLMQRALAIWEEKIPGQPDLKLALGLNNLAVLFYMQGRDRNAQPLLQRALAIRTKSLGPLHPDVADCLSNLASVYRRQANYAEVERLVRQALAIREKMLRP